MLVTPKRKLAGHLAIMQNVLHFSGEFLVEGTGGSSVFNSFQNQKNLDSTKYDQTGGFQKQKPNIERGKGNATDIIEFNASMNNRPNKIKRHRRWNLTMVLGLLNYLFVLCIVLY